MEIKTTNTASFNSKTVDKLQDLLLKLEASTFKAIITNKISHQLFAIQTKTGTLQISTDLPVQVADELTLKVSSKKTTTLENLQVLKINRPISKGIQSATHLSTIKELAPTILLTHQNVLKTIPQTQQHFITKVISHDKSTVHLESLKGELFSLDKESFKNTVFNIKKGEYLAIKWMPDKNIEIQQINKEQLLHQAQRQLLPKQQPLLQTHQRLSQAAFKLFESINNEAKQLASLAKEKTTPNNTNKPQETVLKEQNLKLETSSVQPLKIKNDSLESLIKIIRDNTDSSNNKKITLTLIPWLL